MIRQILSLACLSTLLLASPALADDLQPSANPNNGVNSGYLQPAGSDSLQAGQGQAGQIGAAASGNPQPTADQSQAPSILQGQVDAPHTLDSSAINTTSDYVWMLVLAGLGGGWLLIQRQQLAEARD